MPAELVEIAPREEGVFRIARRPGEVFAPPAWAYADPDDGTFSHRFDDPTCQDGHGEDQRYRMVYCSTGLTCAFAECLGHLRVDVTMAAKLAAATVDPDETVEVSLAGAYDPDDPSRGLIRVDWQESRQIGHTHLEPELRFVDIGAPESLAHLRRAMAGVLRQLQLDDIDLSAITGRQRELTQRCARYLYEQHGTDGQPRFAGIRYPSRYGEGRECWAIFDNRLRHHGSFQTNISSDDPGLQEMARQHEMTIEIMPGYYLRP